MGGVVQGNRLELRVITKLTNLLVGQDGEVK